MPTVLRVGPHRFHFFSDEGTEPPHIHVRTAEREAKYWLEPVELVWARGYNSRELNQLRRIVEDNFELFLSKWYEHPSN